MARLTHLLAGVDRPLRFSRLVRNRANAILTYHSVGDPTKYGNVSASRFESDLEFLTRTYEVVDLPDVLPTSDTSNEKKVALTFDDGYANFYDHALPRLERFDTPATVFVSPGFIGDRNPELIERRHRISASESPVMMTGSQLEGVTRTGLVTIGNHTYTHKRLPTIDDETTREYEIVGAKEALEERLGTSIDRFSYPYGAYDEASIETVSKSHEIAVTIRPELICGDCDAHLLPRIPAHRPESVMRWKLTDASQLIAEFLTNSG